MAMRLQVPSRWRVSCAKCELHRVVPAARLLAALEEHAAFARVILDAARSAGRSERKLREACQGGCRVAPYRKVA